MIVNFIKFNSWYVSNLRSYEPIDKYYSVNCRNSLGIHLFDYNFS